jgi:hypothetical protein
MRKALLQGLLLHLRERCWNWGRLVLRGAGLVSQLLSGTAFLKGRKRVNEKKRSQG